MRNNPRRWTTVVNRKRTATVVVLTAAYLFAAFGTASAQLSPNFDLSVSALGGGGGRVASATFAVESILGQSVAGATTAGTTQLASGLMAVSNSVQLFQSDAFEADDSCPTAKPIAVNDLLAQTHSFHRNGDQDWLLFSATANKTYIIEVRNLGAKSNATISLYNDCNSLGGSGDNSFGSTVRLEWDAAESKKFLVKIQQFDPSQFGTLEETRYEVTVKSDGTPPTAPTNPRCEPKNPSTIGIQWSKSPQRDVVGYRVQYQGNVSGSADVSGKNTTYFELGGLTNGQLYNLRVNAVDFSGNESPFTGQFPCVPRQPEDLTAPLFNLSQPDNGAAFTTSAAQLTFTGNASDTGGNLSRARVASQGIERFDNSLSGSNANFRVENVPLAIGANAVQVAVLDAAGNQTVRNIAVTRLGQSPGAVLIIAGHNESFGLQHNIYFMANRAYRIFASAGYDAASIFYLAPVNQDADGDGVNDVDGTSSPASIQNFITNVINPKVGPGKPLFVYMVDHGFTEKFCGAGCSTGAVTPAQLDGWLRTLETATGLNQVSLVMEACQSGSFIDRADGDATNSLSKAGRVIISSTGRVNNAYASAQGAYFSDAFFSCLVDSNDLKTCFDEGRAAVLTAGVAQTPWLDDNGDAVFNSGDGPVAKARIVTQNFSSNRPSITATGLERSGSNGVLSATVTEGAEEIDLVWASVFPPGFVEPTDVTLNLGVPIVRLEPVAEQPGKYSFAYAGGFPQPGDYRIVFYAQDVTGIAATPKLVGEAVRTFMPLIWK